MPDRTIITKLSYICESFVIETFIDTFKKKQKGKNNMEKLTHQEQEMMLIIFQQGKGFIKDFIDYFKDAGNQEQLKKDESPGTGFNTLNQDFINQIKEQAKKAPAM